MQTSAKTKANEFMKTWGLTKEGDKILLNALIRLLLEHERDTRYAAIDVIRSMEQQSIEHDDIEFNNIKFVDGVETEDTIQKIHNMKVGL